MQVITSHVNADFDTLASMLAAKKLYPDAVLTFPGSLEKNLRDFFEKSSFHLFEVEKIKNIKMDEITRLILVDIRQAARIGKFAEIINRPGLDIHIYDHHPKSPDDIHGSVEVTHHYGATTTILTLIMKQKAIPLTPEEATVLMVGIYEDTGSLTFSSTTVEDYEAAAFLLSNGANLNFVSDMITRELTAEQVSLLNDLLQSATTYSIDGIDVVIAEASADKYMGDIAVLVHRLKDIENINCLFALVSMESRIHLIARSRLKGVNVGEIAQALGGGGHPTAASATLKDITLIQAKERLITVLKDKITPKRFARDIMSSPPITLSQDASINDAKDTLLRYGINAIPVVRGEKVLGIITRQVVEKAAYHGLKDVSVKEYMSTEFETVSPSAAVSEVQEAIIGHHQRLLPVMDGGKIAGIITRTDLLRLLHEELKIEPYSAEDVPLKKHKTVARLMEERLPEKAAGILRDAGNVAEELGYRAYAVGGFVRDLILRYENLDIDVVIEGDGIAFANIFAKRFGCRVKSHERFGTAVVIFPDGFKIDIATARLEYYEKPGALPTVELSSLKLDLYRRDFTINTLAVVLNTRNFGEVIDFFGAQRDIKEKTIRVLHNLSFVEDPTRVLRAIRFEQRYGFVMAKHTQSLIKNAVKLNLLQRISGERLLNELKAIFEEENFLRAVYRIKEFDLIKFIHPAISLNNEEMALLERVKDVLSWYQLLYREEKVEAWVVLFLAVSDQLKDDEALEAGKRLGITGKHRVDVLQSRAEAVKALNMLQMKLAPASLKQGKTLRPSEIYHLLKMLPMEDVLYIMAKTKLNDAKKAISNFITHLKECKTMLHGNDLKRLGVTEGPIYSKILNMLLEKRLDEKIKTKGDEEKMVKEIASKY
ncbi:MAG: CBS domain-containing protein [Deltaproteobacteria bacterium]|nr:CBS domain-containing protein [Deltaproteobacteria bacterium]